MTDRAWKVAEREVAELVGGERVPITGRQRGATPDVQHKWLAIEVKNTRSFPKWLKDAHLQAIASKVKEESEGSETKLPVVIIKPHRTNVRNGYIMMSLGDFVDWFGDVKVPRESSINVEEVPF
jgi:hypothetical protein